MPSNRSQAEDWHNLACLQKKRLVDRASFFSYADEQAALSLEHEKTPFVMFLNGTWKFACYPPPAEAPENFHQEDFVVDQWNDLPVPSCWQMHGYGHPRGNVTGEYHFP